MTDNILAAQAEQRTRALREVALFRSLTDREIALAVEVIEVVSFQRGDYVVRRGEMGSGFFLVDEGECAAEVDNEIARVHVAGGYFGERA